MYKYFVLFLTIICFSACKKEREYISVLYRIVVNETEKDLYLSVKTDEGEDFLNLIETDSVCVVFEKKHIVSAYDYEHMFLQNDPVYVSEEVLYNLTDTTKFIFTTGYSSYPNKSPSSEEEFYSEQLLFRGAGESTDSAPKIMVTLNVSNSLLDIMEKDYSMLEKFKDYYGR